MSAYSSPQKKDTGWKIILIIFSQAKRCGKLLSVCFWDGNLIRKWKGMGLSWAKCLGVWSLVLGWTFPQSKITDTKSINLSARKQHLHFGAVDKPGYSAKLINIPFGAHSNAQHSEELLQAITVTNVWRKQILLSSYQGACYLQM